MPVFGVGDAKYKVDDLAASLLPFGYGLGRMRMGREGLGEIGGRLVGRLCEDTTAVCEGVADGSSELPKNLAHSLLEVLIDLDVLVGTKVAMRQLRESGYLREVGVVFPAFRHGLVGGGGDG